MWLIRSILVSRQVRDGAVEGFHVGGLALLALAGAIKGRAPIAAGAAATTPERADHGRGHSQDDQAQDQNDDQRAGEGE
jgi:hypothetical protein